MSRLLAIAALIAEEPGIAFASLKEAFEGDTGRSWSASTLRADIKTLKDHGLISREAHRTGYFLAGPTFSQDELRVLLNGLAIQAHNLRDPIARDLMASMVARLKGRRADLEALSYPVLAVGNRVVPETMSADFHSLVQALSEAIRMGKEVVIRKFLHPWQTGAVVYESQEHTIMPLQLLFHDVAWYLLAEDASSGRYKVYRMDRLEPAIKRTTKPARGIKAQARRLEEAKRLMELAWGVFIPPPEPHDTLIEIKVHFNEQGARFIAENLRRHESQHLEFIKDGLIYTVRLHPDCLGEFERWVFGWGELAEVVAPLEMRRHLAARFSAAAKRYSDL